MIYLPDPQPDELFDHMSEEHFGGPLPDNIVVLAHAHMLAHIRGDFIKNIHFHEEGNNVVIDDGHRPSDSVVVKANTDGSKLIVHWTGYDRDVVSKVKTLSGAKFRNTGHGKFWEATLNKINIRRLQEQFGQQLVVSSLLKAWITNNDLVGEVDRLRNEVGELRALIMARSNKIDRTANTGGT